MFTKGANVDITASKSYLHIYIPFDNDENNFGFVYYSQVPCPNPFLDPNMRIRVRFLSLGYNSSLARG
jgi:hypothetical protein